MRDQNSIVFAIAGMCFGVILGWVIGTQQAGKQSAAVVQMQSAPAAPGRPPTRRRRHPSAARAGRREGPAADRRSSRAIRRTPVPMCSSATPTSTPSATPTPSSTTRTALKLDPKNVDASTDLGVSYYYSNRADEALKQFDYSLKLEPDPHQDPAQPGHRPGVWQAGPARRGHGRVEAGRRARAGQPGSAGGRARAARASPRRGAGAERRRRRVRSDECSGGFS